MSSTGILPLEFNSASADGKIVLIDFGAVKEIGSQVVDVQGQTKSTVPVGTLAICQLNKPKTNPGYAAISMQWE